MKTYFERILDELLEDSYFEELKYRKRDSSLIKETIYGKHIIKLEHWSLFNISLTIRPSYDVRFDVLCKWFEKFSVKPLRIQRDGWYIGFDGGMLMSQEMFEFPYYETGIAYQNQLQSLKECIIACSTQVFSDYSTLEKAYQKELQPVLEGSKLLPDVGADWFFENLTLCRIVHPEKYKELKQIHLKRAEEMYERNEPNISKYYTRLNEILT